MWRTSFDLAFRGYAKTLSRRPSKLKACFYRYLANYQKYAILLVEVIMSRLQQLTEKPAEFDQIRSLEAERDPFKVTVALSPRSEFLVQNIHDVLQTRSHTATVREVLEAALLDWLESKGYKEDSPEFKEKYALWLSGAHLGQTETGYNPETDEEFEHEPVNFSVVRL